MHRPQTGGASSNPFSCGGGGGSTRDLHYNLNVSMQLQNLLGHNNPGPVSVGRHLYLVGQSARWRRRMDLFRECQQTGGLNCKRASAFEHASDLDHILEGGSELKSYYCLIHKAVIPRATSGFLRSCLC
jgi:hypothetical protein